MSNLGSGLGSSYPSTIDTRQTFQNVPNPVPDSDTRFDAEFCNDTLTAIVQIETALGAGIQGAYASLAARLAAIEAGGGGGTPGLTNVVTFTNQTMVTIPGTAHQQAQQALLYQVYDPSTPRQALQPDAFAVYPTNFDAVTTFGVAQSGVVMVGVLTPQYVTSFTTSGSPPSVLIPGSTHGLAQPLLFFQAFDTGTPAQAIELGSVTVDTTTRDLTLTTAAPQSGTLILGIGTPRYVHTFTNQTTVTVLGSVHGLTSANLLYQVWDAGATPAAVQDGGFTVHPTTFDVVLTFAVAQSGSLLLAPVPVVVPAARLSAPPVPMRTTPLASAPSPQPMSEAALVRLQRTVETLSHGLATLTTLSTRLTTLETAYHTLLHQVGGHTPEDTPA